MSWQVLKQALSSLPRDADVPYLGYSQASCLLTFQEPKPVKTLPRLQLKHVFCMSFAICKRHLKDPDRLHCLQVMNYQAASLRNVSRTLQRLDPFHQHDH